MPKSNHRGASYAGHVDVTPHDVTEPQWQPVSEQPEPQRQPKTEPRPVPRIRTRKR